MTWLWPLHNHDVSIPVQDHDGAFGKKRRYDIHTGVDLYCDPGQIVVAVEPGVVVGIETFTGPRAQSPWWLETEAVLIEGASGVVLYGEVKPEVKVGDWVERGWIVGRTLQVRRTDIVARMKRILHGRIVDDKPKTMLHFELYDKGVDRAVSWNHGEEKPAALRDPTKALLQAKYPGSCIV